MNLWQHENGLWLVDRPQYSHCQILSGLCYDYSAAAGFNIIAVSLRTISYLARLSESMYIQVSCPSGRSVPLE